MRAYTVATAAVALGVGTKWVDNVLSHHGLPGSTRGRQGRARRLSAEAVSVLETALRLARGFGIPVRHAMGIASVLLSRESGVARYQADACEISIDTAVIRSHVARRLEEAVEFTPTPRRGRPPNVSWHR